MPRLTQSVPKYRKHRASGQAVVTVAGRDHYLGPYGTKASRLEYDRLITEWLASGRPSTVVDSDGGQLTITELCARYWQFAKKHYRKNGKGTSEQDNIKYAIRPLRQLYGRTLVKDFGPLALKALQVRMIDDGLSRGVINSRIGKVKRMFRWAVSEELAPASLDHSLNTVMGLQKGRTKARESEPVEPVDDETVHQTLPFLPSTVADMVRFQRLTGARPQDVCNLRPCDLDRSGDVWLYCPEHHKTEHYGKTRVICIGPQAQEILLQYLLRDAEAYCFSPAESERKRKAELRANRRTAVQPSQVDRSTRSPKRKPRDQYTTNAYLYAVRRACDRAFLAPEPLRRSADESVRKWEARLTDKQRAELEKWQSDHRWAPNRLRHSAGTEIRKRFGLEAAQVILGHASADVTQVYAERDLQKAVEIMREVG
jgi:integrase